jgi:hypothetical protein
MYEIPYSTSGKFMTPIEDNTVCRNDRKLSIRQFMKKYYYSHYRENIVTTVKASFATNLYFIILRNPVPL